jgi:hypothetical protein
MTLSQQIKTKIRRLTNNPSTNQLSDSDLDEYIDAFVEFDFPSALKIWNLHDKYDFFTEPYNDTYKFDTKLYHAVVQPVYVDGFQATYSQSRNDFFNIYPEISVQYTGPQGNGSAGPYNFFVSNVPFMKNQVEVYAIDTSNVQQIAYDVPQLNNNYLGDLFIGNSQDPTVNSGNTTPAGTVNYVTGEVTITFPNTIPSTQNVYAKVSSYLPSRPVAVLFFNDTFTVRPVPNQVYRISVEVYKKPSQVLALQDSDNDPNLLQWWQYIAYGAAMKVLQDRQDMESISNIMPFWKEQEALVLYRTAVQQAQERTGTIYSSQLWIPYGPFGFGSN